MPRGDTCSYEYEPVTLKEEVPGRPEGAARTRGIVRGEPNREVLAGSWRRGPGFEDAAAVGTTRTHVDSSANGSTPVDASARERVGLGPSAASRIALIRALAEGAAASAASGDRAAARVALEALRALIENEEDET